MSVLVMIHYAGSCIQIRNFRKSSVSKKCEKCELIPINVEPTAASAQLPDSFEGNHQPTSKT